MYMAGTFSDTTIKLQAITFTLNDSSLLQEMTINVHIYEVNMSSLTSDRRDGGGFDVANLANKFGIGVEAAKRTRLVTTQSMVKRMIHPIISVRFRMNDRQLIYRRLPVTCCTDIINFIYFNCACAKLIRTHKGYNRHGAKIRGT
jgi:hypothetical protein